MKTMTPSEEGRQVETGSCPVVGIGASAGGLEAIKVLLSHLPKETGMAYVVVQHLDPSHPSLLPDLLARTTILPVREVTEGMLVEADCVYVTPANATLTLAQGVFRLTPRTQSGGKLSSIDRFLTSLAHARGPQAVGVVLSGTASDGTVGLQTIKAEGGITFAQDPATASFPQMPQSAIALGCVDHVLSPEEIAATLAEMGEQVRRANSIPGRLALASEDAEVPRDEPSFTSLLHLVSQQSGVDFLSSYKPATLVRRIRTRMAFFSLSDLSAYAAYLQEHPSEVEALEAALLIAVTDFFRDPEVFEGLARLVWPHLIRSPTRSEPLRIWVPGCATGEEAYTLAMCLLEFLQAQNLEQPFQIFASDVNAKVVEEARAGIYPASRLATVGVSRLARFFTPLDQQRSRYRIHASVRERCIFAPHNLLQDPPFSRLDLISCRNVLIYLRAPFQQQIIQTFHYALLPEGFLLLGTSESIEPFARLFHRVERGMSLYRKHAFGGSLLPPLGMNQGKAAFSPPEIGEPAMAEEQSEGGDLLQQADRLLLAHYVPASVVIDANQEIVQVRGQTDLYLHLAMGRANLNVLRMARPGLSVGLRAALHAARKERRTIIREGLRVSAFGTSRQVRVTVIPLKGPPADHYCLVLFEEEQESPPAVRDAVANTPEPSGRKEKRDRAQRRITGLEQELIKEQTEMQAILEERDATTEELQAANEEILASNEELQSLNEELETSQEELQTINEELSTANQELSTRNEQLKATQDYADSIVETVRSPLIVLSEELCVERANVAFYQFFQTVPPETEGHLLYELGNGQWNIPRLRTLLEEILPTNHSLHDFEVEHHFPRIGSKTMLLNARRLLLERQPSQKHLILLALEDVTERKRAQRQTETHLDLLQRILDALPASVYLVQGEEARLVLANRATTTLWGVPWSMGQPMLDFLATHHIRLLDTHGEVLPPAAFATLRALREGNSVWQHQEVIQHADGTTLSVLVNAAVLDQDALGGWEVAMGTHRAAVSSPAALVVHQDVTALVEADYRG
jgi:two-component system CheB/CheR fusion protein